MAKSFLDTLEDAFADDVLEDIIPDSRQTSAQPATRRSARSGKGASRKKSFLSHIEENLPEVRRARPASDKPVVKPDKQARKSFLETIEEAYDSSAFDDIMPTRTWTRREVDRFDPEVEMDRRVSSLLTPEVRDRLKQIAIAKGIRVRDVLQRALELYLSEL